MPNYECPKCHKVFKKKSNIQDHLRRKNPCDKLFIDVTHNVPENVKNLTQNMHGVPLYYKGVLLYDH